MECQFPKRKSTRLQNFDYSKAGAYFVTICTADRQKLLSEIVFTNDTEADGLAVQGEIPSPEYSVKLTPCGKIAKEQLLLLEHRFQGLAITDYVIMPDHIHAIIFLHNNDKALVEATGGASPSPTLNDVLCAFKSLTSRICKKQYGTAKIFQRSFADHIIRDGADYETRKKYIYENPMRWYYTHATPRSPQW